MEKPKATLDSWEEFEGSLRELNKCRIELLKDSAEVSKILFRGQSDSERPLESTLDRFFAKQVSLLEYCKIIAEVKPRDGRLHASYLHLYFPSNPQAVARLFAP